MALPLETVVKQLTDSGIIGPGKLEDFVPPKAAPKDGEALLRELHKQGLLTKFQAQQVAAGKARALLLGEYTILDKIGAGGMGQVFKAVHRRMDRLVAIKMLPTATMKDAAAVARFEREVKAAAKLRHPQIVAADDAGYANGVHFLVMEYVEGQDLSALVKKNGPFPVDKAVNYILQAARGLEFAHSEGVIHRDIKPANLLLDKKGVVKILDMGLARIEQTGGAVQAELTGTGAIMGTVDYMAPEQGMSTKHADARADIYSLGCSLYYLLGGKAIYDGETVAAKLVAHHTSPLPDLRAAQPEVPAELDAIFKRMVAKSVDERYQSMSEVVAALAQLAGNQPTGSTIAISSATMMTRPAMPGAPAKKTGFSRPALIGLATTGAAAVAVALGVIFWPKPRDEAPLAQTPATSPASAFAPPSPLVGEGPGVRGPAPLVAPFDAKQAHAGQMAWAKHLGTKIETINSVGMRMTLIPPGEFLMGSTPEQVAWGRKSGEDDKMPPTDSYWERLLDEMPQHKVTISQPFLIGGAEVTVAQFRKFVEASKYETEAEKYGFGNSVEKVLTDKVKEADKGKNWKNPGYPTTDDTAVTQITWNDACAYCAWLSEQEQQRPWYRPDGKGGWLIAAHADGYRLPTEAEWEYACRAGTTTQYSFGDDKAQLERYGWFNKSAGGKAQPVALKLPNPFGLFDIHGNAYEWCQDWYDKKWYEKSSPSEPNGPSSGLNRMVRGGFWNYNASYCRSASRYSYAPSNRNSFCGFRVVRAADSAGDTQLATNTPPTLLPPGEGGRRPDEGAKPWNTPAFQQWVKATQALPAEQQIEAVSKKLMELNPGFDGKVTGYTGKGQPKIENGVVTEIGFFLDNVTDISPVRALAGLRFLSSLGSAVGAGKLSDLSPLEGIKLTRLGISNTALGRLSPLEGMPLTVLTCVHTFVSDLSPLQGMPLTTLFCYDTQVSDLSPLENCKSLNELSVIKTKVTPASIAALQRALPNCKIEWDDPAKAAAGQPNQPWNTPVFQVWVKEVQAIPAEEQVKAVSKKLMELNPGFDGKVTGADGKGTPKIENGVVISFGFITDKVTDISPVRALVEVKSLNCNGNWPHSGRLADLSPLRGMVLKSLSCGSTQVSDLSPLQGMPMEWLSCYSTNVSTLSPLVGMPLKNLSCSNTPVSDLKPLTGMQLTNLTCPGTKVSDLTPLTNVRTLSILDVRFNKVTPSAVAALQEALPNCKIDWDAATSSSPAGESAKPKTPEPAASGTK